MADSTDSVDSGEKTIKDSSADTGSDKSEDVSSDAKAADTSAIKSEDVSADIEAEVKSTDTSADTKAEDKATDAKAVDKKVADKSSDTAADKPAVKSTDTKAEVKSADSKAADPKAAVKSADKKSADKKSAGKSDKKVETTRRSFLTTGFVGWTAFAAGIAGFFGTVIRLFAPNVLYEPEQMFRVGSASEYGVGEVSVRWKTKYGIWIVRLEDRIIALSTTCTHLGCTPNWLASEKKFKCPCHGSAFRMGGVNFEGPAPRPLERFKIYLDDEGIMIVDKTTTFRDERGQWDDPASFVAV